MINTNLTFNFRDEFRRKKIAENLIKLIEAEFATSPMVVDGPWGSGKSEFCQKFMNLIISSGKNWNVIYIDAFRFDHVEDPLIMLITQITSSLPDSNPDKQDLVKKSLPVLKVIGKVAGKAAVSWVLKQNADDIGDDFSKAIEEGSESLIEVGIQKTFEDFEKIEENLQIFKNILKKIAAEKKLVICIDELDRCRPSFTLSILEKVKHVFDIPNIEFVFMANLVQVESMVKKQYGHEIDSKTYLTKFFPVSIKLSSEYTMHGDEYNRNAFKLFCNNVYAHNDLNKFFKPDHYIETFFENLFKKDKISLRDSERFFQNILIYNTVSNNQIKEHKHWMYVLLWCYGIYIYTFNDQLTQKFLDNDLKLKDLLDIFNVNLVEFQKESDDRNIVHEVFALFVLDLPASEVAAAIPDKEQLKKWQENSFLLFKGLPGSGPARGKRIKVSSDAIRSMQLF